MTAVISAACTLELVPQDKPAQPTEDGSYVFSLNATAGNLTKTSYADEMTFSWTAGDQISVLFHKDSDNKFFTLTTASSGANVTFSGDIEAGYEIGASTEGNPKVALFPASPDHSYNAASATPVVFNIPILTDFTKSHFSANIPMFASGDGDNNFSFKHIAGGFKVVFTSIDPSISKVRLHVKNQTTKKLSGNFTLQDSNTRWWDEWASEGSDDQTVDYVVNVVEGKATFYIPYGHNQEHFQPDFTLTNAVNGNTLKVLSAKAAFSGDNKPRYDRLVVLPEIPASGTGTSPGWRSNHEINWDMVNTSVNGRTSENLAGINTMKVTSDATNIYVLLDIKSSYLVDNDDYDYSNYLLLYAGDGSDTGTLEWMWTTKQQNCFTGWMKTANSTTFSKVDGSIIDAIANIDGDHGYYEIAIARTGNSALLGTTAYLGCVFNKQYYDEGAIHNDPSQGDTYVGYAPTPWTSMFEVSLPTYFNPSKASSPVEQTYTEATGEVSSAERGMMSYSKFKFENDEIPSVKSIPLDYTGESLAFLLFYLTDYMNKDLDSGALTFIRSELAKVREANKKAIVRFAYTETHTENTQHEATPTQILKHIDQIADIISDNADIIYLIQAGWLGTYGEWYYKTKNHGETLDDYDDYYLYTVSGSAVTDLNNNHKKLLDKMLATTPAPIQIGLRTAFYKRYYLSPSAIGSWTEITDWGTSSNHRLAFYNDGIRGSASDVGTFDSDTDRNMWYSQGNWTACGGEMSYRSADAFAALSDDLKDCDQSIAEMRRQHLSYLHYSESNRFMVKWIGEGRMEDIKKALGYRLVLNSAALTFSALTSGESVNYTISIQNKGCAPVIYSRPFKLVVIHDSVATVLVDNLMDVRNLSAGASATELTGSFDLPYSLSVGDKLAIWLPDPDPLGNGLDDIPAYSIRLANSDVTWENGYNVIHTF